MRKDAIIETVVNFGDLQVFEGVTTYPAILTMRRGKASKDHALRFWNVEALLDSNFSAIFAERAITYPQMALTSGSWELEGAALKALRDKITKGRKTIKEVYGRPSYGIKTGLNKAFIIDTPSKEKICAQDPKSADLLKPFLEGKDLKRWRAEPRGLWIIYVPKNRININDYPAIRDWLQPFKEQLEERATKQEWFELQQAQEAYSHHFAQSKISYRDIASENPFHLDTSGSYLDTTGFAIPSDDYATVAILNSKVIWFLFKSLTPLARGGFFRMKSQYISQLSLPEFPAGVRDELERCSKAAHSDAEHRFILQTAILRRILDLVPHGQQTKLSNKLMGWWKLPDFASFRSEVKKCFKADIPLSERSAWEDWISRDKAEIARLTGDIKSNERQINEIVYKLFGLTTEEIHLLEASI